MVVKPFYGFFNSTVVREESNPDLNELVHTVCLCNENIALCGEVFEDDDPYCGDLETECVVCAEMSSCVCPRCGQW